MKSTGTQGEQQSGAERKGAEQNFLNYSRRDETKPDQNRIDKKSKE